MNLEKVKEIYNSFKEDGVIKSNVILLVAGGNHAWLDMGGGGETI